MQLVVPRDPTEGVIPVSTGPMQEKISMHISSGLMLPVQEEPGNEHDSYAVSVQKAGTIVGHVPHEVSRIFTFFIRHGGTIVCEATGHRKPGKGLEVPCCYKLTGKPKHIKKAGKLFPPYLCLKSY